MSRHITVAAAVTLSLSVGAGVGTLIGTQLGASDPNGSGSTVTGVTSDAAGAGQENEVRGVTDEHGSVQAIRGIDGIDTVKLQNLEAVLRMQDRPQEPKGESRTAAALVSSETDEDFEEVPDAREIHQEFELEGS
jgi:hypothetical protein